MVRRARQGGASYLALLIAVALLSGALASAAALLSETQRREREKQLLWAGDQIRRALLDYARAGPGQADFPERLEDLLADPRVPFARRFLRRLYLDPLTGKADWGLQRDARQRIVGVFSQSPLTPLKTGNFPPPYESFQQARSYADWQFAAAPGQPTAIGGGPGGIAEATVLETTAQPAPLFAAPRPPGPAASPVQPAALPPPAAPGRRVFSEPAPVPPWNGGAAGAPGGE